ncbi:MAG: biotin carboxylase N-terminal domain-containing protein [Candidatus Caldarchaeum sp.]|nr:biotin carboxylase N-terminal domain-containing protein [Candidatus Caldarchaeum sp.]
MTLKVLIANRGEIAVRVMRTCRKMGFKTIAVYSDADAQAPHVKLADEAFHLGPSNPLKSYLNIGKLREAIEKTKPDMVHPGYGFLAENAEFAKAVTELGVNWVGPPAHVMKNLSSKTFSRRMAKEAGIPIIPGSLEPLTFQQVGEIAQQLGYPILIKPDRGGGGKGTKLVRSAEELTETVYFSAAREAEYAFGKPDVYVERLLEKPRHIEVQVISDTHGNVFALGERECSIQRRYQKIIEEAPSPVVSPQDREYIFEIAKRYAQKIGYVNAGTVEMLRDVHGNFYFLEMNKRIQVEHPVTELTTGLDIVELQFRVALGQELEFESDQQPIGHSIECRIYAEDPVTFFPSPGVVTGLRLPPDGMARIDHALELGVNVSPFYDPLIAKAITYGTSRKEAIQRMNECLRSFKIEGIKTNIPFLLGLLGHRIFLEASFYTNWVNEVIENKELNYPSM